MLIAAADTETTGLRPGSRPAELAAVLFDDETGDIKDCYERLIFPGMPMPASTTEIHGITDEMLEGKQSALLVFEEFFDWLPAGTPLAFHNAPYDCGVIAWDAARVGFSLNTQHPVIDTVEIAKSIGATRNNKLPTLVEHYDIKTIGNAHRAGSDADAVMRYYLAVRGQHSVTPRSWLSTGYDYRYTSELPPSMADLPSHVENGTPIEFAYTDGKGQSTERTVTPYGWALINGEVRFHGACHLRDGALRDFRMDRVQSIQSAA